VTRTGLALVHQGEYVVPKGGALATGTGGAMHATFVAELDGEVLWKKMQKFALRDMMRNGTRGSA
jgi:hypothetical protein